ncbi:hypothetical protein CEXT_338251 [Caerostris extrusa]|uniref:Uncharacterized protein n=1 Tax=Caerostris extrusa TaxID=172846 RepID=A0AAV4WZU3_CAEEX|nr:hypothetical protein CEXT_338251 [Caerostris extrusa]
MCRLDYTHLDINLELTKKVLKRNITTEQLKSIVLETVESRFQEMGTSTLWYHGNERAELFTKKGISEAQRPTRALSFHSLKLLTIMTFKHNFKSEGTEASSAKNWAILNGDISCVPDVPRAAAVARFRLTS